MLNLKYIFQLKYLCSNKVFFYCMWLWLFISCQPPQKSQIKIDEYPYEVSKKHLESIYDQARWVYYRQYANSSPTLLKTAINHEWDTVGLPKRLDLITCDLDTSVFIFRVSKDTFEMSFCFNCKSHTLCREAVFSKYHSYKDYYPYVVYYSSKGLLGVGCNGYVSDSVLTHLQRQEKDTIFKQRLILFQDELPAWLKQEAIRRGIIKNKH